MIPLIQSEIENHGWLSASEFVDIIAVAEMTPGPIAVNSATFVGFKTAGVLGSVVATLGVALPSFVLIIAISGFFFKFRQHKLNIMIFYGIRPVVTGMIAAAGIFVAQTCIFKTGFTQDMLNRLFSDPTAVIDFTAVVILLGAFTAILKFKFHPIAVIAGAAVTGIILYGLIPLV